MKGIAKIWNKITRLFFVVSKLGDKRKGDDELKKMAERIGKLSENTIQLINEEKAMLSKRILTIHPVENVAGTDVVSLFEKLHLLITKEQEKKSSASICQAASTSDFDDVLLRICLMEQFCEPCWKSDWQKFYQVLKDNNITILYHFTDKENIDSIKKNGGLYSWYSCEKRGINIPFPGGDKLSRKLDESDDLQDYVRLSFCNVHPMKYTKIEKKRREAKLLRVSIEVIYFEKTQFSDRNATDSKDDANGVRLRKIGPNIQNLQSINFEATKMTYLRHEDPNFGPHQAEVLVKSHIPIKYIENINDL